MEQFTFNYKRKQFIITLNGKDAGDIIEVIYPNNTNKYLYEFGHEVRLNKIQKYVYVSYKEEMWDIEGILLKTGIPEFQATNQENFNYFYDMMTGNSKLGTTLDKMVIDGFLIDKFELQQGVFNGDGNFNYPIWATSITTTNATDPATMDLTITVENGLEDKIYTFTLLNSELPVQTSNVFTGLTTGTYQILIESPNSMPFIEAVTIPEPISESVL